MAGSEGNEVSAERDEQTKKKRASARHNMRNRNRSALPEAALDTVPKTAAALSPRIAPAKRPKFLALRDLEWENEREFGEKLG
jgi:hypothetical protein